MLIGFSSVSVKNSNVYISGSFDGGWIELNPDGGDYYIPSGEDIFVSKFHDNGDYQWGRAFQNEAENTAYDVATDNSGNAYVTGDFMFTMDFDPGSGEDLHSTPGGYGAFLLKLLPNVYW